MSNFERILNDLDRGGRESFQDASRAFREDIQYGHLNPRQGVDAINQAEMRPEHAGRQIQLVNDGYGHLDIAPVNYGRELPPPPPRGAYGYEDQPYRQPGFNPNQALGAGIVGGIILDRLLRK